jgi:hypothetical protein
MAVVLSCPFMGRSSQPGWYHRLSPSFAAAGDSMN